MCWLEIHIPLLRSVQVLSAWSVYYFLLLYCDWHILQNLPYWHLLEFGCFCNYILVRCMFLCPSFCRTILIVLKMKPLEPCPSLKNGFVTINNYNSNWISFSVWLSASATLLRYWKNLETNTLFSEIFSFLQIISLNGQVKDI